MHSEWELLAITEDIEQGDYVVTEDDEGNEEKLMFVKVKGGSVLLKDENGELFSFSASSLEENEGYRIIIGKAE